jgi:hypothetical protein
LRTLVALPPREKQRVEADISNIKRLTVDVVGALRVSRRLGLNRRVHISAKYQLCRTI